MRWQSADEGQQLGRLPEAAAVVGRIHLRVGKDPEAAADGMDPAGPGHGGA